VARIAFAWELGGDFGHAMACDSLARLLRLRGHHIAFMFRELYQLGLLPECAAHDVFQAPVSISEGRGIEIPASYAEILMGCGYDRPDHVAGLLGGWIALFKNWKPDFLVSDYAPTALLAARMLGIRRVSYGNGFAIPPRLSPLPAFRFDEPIAPERVRDADARALASANGALARFGGAPLQSFAQQFETDDDFLTTFPELDSYGTRPTSGYWGPRFSVDTGADVAWPQGTGKRVLVYVKKGLPQLDALIAALVAGGHRVAAFIPELDAARVASLRGPGRVVAERPIKLAPLLAQCDLFVSQGGNVNVGTLMAGVPQLVFPTQYEQYLTARRIEQLGAGLWLPRDASSQDVSRVLDQVLRDPAFSKNAKAYAGKYRGYTPLEQNRRIVVRIEEILAQPSRWSALPGALSPSILAATPRTPDPR
jgi:UDP:flavonoid glycosyltransferase YjiC (YdhE family)